ncbi:MAG: lysophospholipid acyltransferase family protein [Gammaproteobacteria bacterium]
MLTTIRSWMFYSGLIPLTVFFSIISVCVLILPSTPRYKTIITWSKLALWWLRITCDLHWAVRGIENITDQPGVILCKHQSAWETIAMQMIFPKQTQVLKKELLSIPFFGWGLACLNPIAINRKRGAKSVKKILDIGQKRIKDGWWVLFFPEGTRIAVGENGRFTQTGAALALEANCPIIPVAHNAGVFWKKNTVKKYPGTIEVIIGAPISTAGRSRKNIIKDAENWIDTMCAKLPSEIGTN